MATADRDSDNYSDKAAKQRFEAALRGARAVGHKPMERASQAKIKKKQKPKKSKASA